jgi:hypothetical protein
LEIVQMNDTALLSRMHDADAARASSLHRVDHTISSQILNKPWVTLGTAHVSGAGGG